jgi:hypothetical protein
VSLKFIVSLRSSVCSVDGIGGNYCMIFEPCDHVHAGLVFNLTGQNMEVRWNVLLVIMLHVV